MGIYMFHDNVHMRFIIYKFLGVDKPVFSCRFVLYVFIIAILIYVVCSVIELIRQQLFKFISNRKISKKIRDKFNDWLHSIKFKTVPETS